MSGDALSIWIVYDHPPDFPWQFVARRWQVGPPPAKPIATDDVIAKDDLECLRSELADMGLTRLDRHPGDDPRILETWL